MTRTLATALVALLLTPGAAAARAGDADREFGTGGIVVLEPGSSAFRAVARPAGGFVTAGFDAIRRLTRSGTLAGAPMRAPLSSEDPLALDAQGRLVQAAADGSGTTTVTRTLPDGRPDPAFGGDGRVERRSPPGDSDDVSDLAVTRHGRILIAGATGGDPFLLALRPDGSLDRRFGRRGVVRLTGTGGYFGAIVRVRRDGRVLLAGSGGSNSETFDLVALRPSGRPDRRVGRVRVDPETLTNVGVDQIVELSRGRLLIAGSGTDSDGLDVTVVARLRSGGRLDRRYGRPPGPAGARGFVSLFASGTARGMAVDRRGRAVVATSGPTVFRLRRDGRFDRRFGRDGRADLPFAKAYASARTAGLRLGRRGRILVAGTLRPGEPEASRLFMAALKG